MKYFNAQAPRQRTNTEMTAVPSPSTNYLACFLPICHSSCHLYHRLYLCSHFYRWSQCTHPIRPLVQNGQYAVMVQRWKSTLMYICSLCPARHLRQYLHPNRVWAYWCWPLHTFHGKWSCAWCCSQTSKEDRLGLMSLTICITLFLFMYVTLFLLVM